MSLDVDGLSQLERYLEETPRRDAKKAVRKGLTPGMRKLVLSARQSAPVRTGRLRRAIKAKSANRRFLQRGEIAKDLFINPGKSRDDQKGAWYGQMVNSGYLKANGEHVPGRHFMEAAYQKTGNDAASIAQEKILETLEQAADEHLKTK